MGTGFRPIFEPKHVFSDNVAHGDLGGLYSKVAKIQNELEQRIEMVQNHSSLLLAASEMIEDQAMFNATARAWEEVVAAVQSRPQLERCRWVNVESCSNLKANKHHVCHRGPC